MVAGTPDGVVMVEAGANQLPEQDVIEAIDFGYEAICELIKAQEQLLKDLGITQVKPENPRTRQHGSRLSGKAVHQSHQRCAQQV